jgi:Carboxypeptidase regulatory-like domain
MFRLICRSLFAVLACTPFLLAQTPDMATVRGQVRDQSRAAVVGAEIKIKNDAVGSERTTTSDSSGAFFFSGLPAGSYTLSTHKQGFADVTRDLTLAGGSTAQLRLALSVNAIQTQVVVTGTVGEIGLG